MLHIFREFRNVWRTMLRLSIAVDGLEKKMADLDKAEKDVEASEDALEARVSAHEDNLKAVSADLQKQIDALKANPADNSAAIAALVALKGKLDAFDPDAPAPASP